MREASLIIIAGKDAVVLVFICYLLSVLPKWSVTIEAPATVIQSRSATFKVCAK